MILVIDIGNTTIAFTGLVYREAAGENELPEMDILFEKKLPTETGRDESRFMAEAQSLLENAVQERKESGGDPLTEESELDRISLVAISSVVPPCTPSAEALAQEICPEPAVLINSNCDTGMNFERIGAPEAIGADRLADMVWAAYGYPIPSMTVDLGTATTINVIGRVPGDNRPAFLGGMIGAGIRSSLLALHALTAQLPALEPRMVTPEEFIGTDTETNMLSSAVVGTAAMIEGMADRVEDQLGEPVSLILTGGNSRFVSPWMRRAFSYEPSLAAKGAAAIAMRESRRRGKTGQAQK